MIILVLSEGPESWRRLLAEPEKQWRDGYSAKALAETWEGASGFPSEISDLFESGPSEQLAQPIPLIGIPEYRVDLPGGSRPSQNDLFVLASTGEALAVIMVEGKVSEPFGPTLAEWLVDASTGKRERLAYLCDELGLKDPPPGTVRYQLLHRAASSVIEARRYRARFAVMLVHSFSPTHESLEDYQAFLTLFGRSGGVGQLVGLSEVDGVELFVGWAAGRAA